MKKILLIIFLLLLLVLPSVYSRSFSIPDTNITYNLNPNGVVNVSQNQTYNFKGCFSEIYTQKPNNLKILNATGSCENKDCVFRHDLKNTHFGEQELILKGNYCDESVTVNFNYDIVNVVNQIKDASQFFYILYGNKTSVPTALTINLNVPGDFNDTNYFIHSNNYDLKINNKHMTIFKNVRSYEPMEINLLMPKDWFIKSDYISSNNSTVSEIFKSEADWNKDYNKYMDTLSHKSESLLKYILIWFLISISPFILFILLSLITWFIFGREYSRKKVNFFEIYQRELPNLNDDPLTANYFIEGRFSKNWFSSGILYLVWKEFYNLEKRDEVFYLIKRKVTKDKSILPEYALKIYDFLNKNFKESEINLDDLHKQITSGYDYKSKTNNEIKKEFRSLYLSLKKDYDKKFFDNKNIYIKTGKKIFIIIWFTTIFLSIYSNFLILIVYLILFLIFRKSYALIFGRFTKDGRIKNLKWKGFKKYITDFSEMKNHPPRSVILWDAYLVYATAFGIAKEVSKNIKTINSIDQSNNLNYNVYSTFIMSNSFTNINNASSFGFNNSNSGFGGGFGGGGFGGGFGGGAGGGGSGAI